MRCPVCGDSSPATLFWVGNYQVVRCRRCGLNFTWPPPSPKILKTKYYSNYRSAFHGDRFSLPLDKLIKLWRHWRVRSISKLSTGGPILDMGCGQATELRALQKRGFPVLGYELLPSASLPVPILTQPRQLLRIQPHSLALISFFHSLEHFPRPHYFLKTCIRLLKKNGFLIIAFPNFASVEARLFTSHWFHLDIPRHLSHFTDQWLINFLTARKFTLVKKSRFAPEYDLYSLLQSSLNVIFPSAPNLLYHLLLRHEKKSPREFLSLLPQLPLILFFIPLILIVLPFMWLTSSTGTSQIILQLRSDS